MRLTFYTIILILSFSAFTSSVQAQKRYQFTTDEGNFKIKFPVEFTTERTEKESATTTKTSCTVDDQTFMASYTLHETELIDHIEMAEVSAESFGESINGTLQSKTDWTVNNHTGLIAIFDLPEVEAKVEYRVVLVEQIQYQVIVLAKNINYNEEMAADFFKSFKLMN